MGNTNIPQFGAADTANSHDTRKGAEQLTPEQKKQRDAQAQGGLGSLLPDSVANESNRVVEHANHGENVIGAATLNEDSGPSSKRVEENPATLKDRAALIGHVDTGYSPSDAT